MSGTKTIFTCPYCHSACVMQDAYVNMNSGEVHLYDSKTCGDCGEEFNSADESEHAVFEVEGHGFNAEDDATDDRVLWVMAPVGYDPAEVIAGTGATWGSPLDVPMAYVESDADFILPFDTEELRKQLMRFKEPK